jgi:hypothetical protein
MGRALTPEAFMRGRTDKMGRLHNAICKEVTKRKLTPAEVYIVLELVKKQMLAHFEASITKE